MMQREHTKSQGIFCKLLHEYTQFTLISYDFSCFTVCWLNVQELSGSSIQFICNKQGMWNIRYFDQNYQPGQITSQFPA